MDNYKVLYLTLCVKSFEVMVTGEKSIEFCKPSDRIKNRLFNKDGTRREYDVVKAVDGYGNDKPFFVAIFNGFGQAYEHSIYPYSNGLEVSVDEGDFMIYLGDIIKKGNLKS